MTLHPFKYTQVTLYNTKPTDALPHKVHSVVVLSEIAGQAFGMSLIQKGRFGI